MTRSANGRFIALVLLLSGGVGVVYWYTSSWEPLPERVAPAPQPEQIPAGPVAQVQRTDGVLELRFGNHSWQAAEVGAELQPGTDLRTTGESSAVVSLGDSAELTVMPDTVVALSKVESRVTQLVVGEGSVTVDVKPQEGRVVRVAARGSDAVAETRDGTVTFLTDGKGNVATGVSRGSATLTAAGESVAISAGQQSMVSPGKAPRAPTTLPGSFLLRVQWPGQGATSKARHRVRGTTTPGALVRIAGQLVVADDQGRFEAVIELVEGENRVPLQTVDAAGRRGVEQSPTIDLDTMAPAHRVNTGPDLWKQDSKQAP